MPTTYAHTGNTDGTWTAAGNWTPGGGPPGAGDGAIFDGRSTRALTGSPAASPQLARIDHYANAKDFGTPSTPIAVSATEINVNLPPVDGSSGGGAQFHISTGTNAGTILHQFASGNGTNGQEPCTFKSGTPGSGSNVIIVSGGTLGIAKGSPGDAATVTTVTVTGTGSVNVGVGTVTGFNLICNGSSAKALVEAATSGTLTLIAGQISTDGIALIATLTGYSGTFYVNHRVAGASNSITTMNVRGATFDFSGDASACQVGTTNYRKGNIIAATSSQLTLTTVTLDFDINTKLQLSAA
jgi:hypothetical protein